ncbi:hypothetical protein BGZ76_002988 [Entomortierella beljakovae]|nr:hypothetical protein BGZ76_002988 [Entomortierella beljakovae]
MLQPSADPRVNDRGRIQNAIDWVGRLPLQRTLLKDGKTVIFTRGTVLLQAGIYRIQGALILNRSGVVLRGEGNGSDGTVLIATGQFKHDFIHLNGLLDSSFQGTPNYLARYGGSKLMSPKDPYVNQDKSVSYVQDRYVTVGSTRLPVKDITNFNVGAEVVVEWRPKPSWVHLLGTDRIPPRPADPDRTMNWDARQYVLRYVRKIMRIERQPSPIQKNKTDQVTAYRNESPTQIYEEAESDKASSADRQLEKLHWQGNDAKNEVTDSSDEYEDYEDEEEEDTDTSPDNPRWVPGYLTLDIPLVMSIDPDYGNGVVYNFQRETQIPTDVGVENLALWSEFDPDNLEDESHGWFAIMIDHCENCWVTDVKTTNFVSGIKAAAGSKHVTIQDCEIHEPISLPTEGGRRYMYMIQGQMVLVKRCFATDARHDFMTGAKTPGPNVFVDSEGIRANNDAGPHDRWATGTLYDNIHSHDFNIRNRGWMGSGQGWAGAFHVVYSCSADVPGEFQSPPMATNWIVNYRGALGTKEIQFKGDEATFLEPEAKDLNSIPRSLYWSQLVARMGGNNATALLTERLVGAQGKNVYPHPSATRHFTTAVEMLATQRMMESYRAYRQLVKSQQRWESGKVDDKIHFGEKIEANSDIQDILNKFEEEEMKNNNPQDDWF